MSRKLVFLLLALALLVAGCQYFEAPQKKTYETFTINASDGVGIAVNYYPSASNKGLILLHSLGRNKDIFKPYAPTLQNQYKIIVPDLRGHGQSDLDFTDFTDTDFKHMIYDVEAAAAYLEGVGVAPENISLAGASIGANLALLYATAHPVDKLLLLSPGSNYRGLDLSRVSYDGQVFIQVGSYDAYSAISVDDLELLLPYAHVMTYDSSAHATDLLQYDLSAKEDFLFYLS